MSAESTPSVDIVIPAFDAAAYLAESLPAALSASRGARVVVVDAGSEDATCAVAQQLGAEVVRAGRRLGPAAARNLGAARSDAEVLLFLDADCVAHADVVARVRAAFADDRDLVSFTGSYDADPPDPGLFSQYMNLRHHFTHQRSRREGASFWAGCGAVRRSAFERAGGFDEARYPRPSIEDIELGQRLARLGPTRLDPDLQVTHLKRWSLRSVVETDIRDRAIPWSRLVLDTGSLPDDLNLRRRERWAAVVAPFALAGLAALPWAATRGGLAALSAALPALVAVALQWELLGFFLRRRGARFAILAGLFHQVHLVYAAAAFAACVLQRRIPLLAIMAAGYAATLAFSRGLDFELVKDEVHYWPTALDFSVRLPPSLDGLRAYSELTTPLSFLLWGSFERLLGLGPAGARLLVLLLSIGLALRVGLVAFPERSRGVLCVIGLFAFPYFLPLSIHIYTDVIAAFFVVFGLALHRGGYLVAGALAFAAAIATRQYMVAFPAALALYEGAAWLRDRSRSLRPIVLPAAAAASLGLWIALFGGLVTPSALERWPTPMVSPFRVAPSHAVHLLGVLGAFFVIPELLLLRRWKTFRAAFSPRGAAIAAAVLLAFAWAPPAYPPGYAGPLNRAAHFALPDETLRVAAFFPLAWLACVRFSRPGLGALLVALNLAIMLKTWIPWEKYALPLVAALWYLASQHALDEASVEGDAG